MENNDRKYAYTFIGERDSKTHKPAGFVRMINMYGNIFEGEMTQDAKLNGFCICFLGSFNTIDIGWYKDNRPNGNWLRLNTENLEVKE